MTDYGCIALEAFLKVIPAYNPPQFSEAHTRSRCEMIYSIRGLTLHIEGGFWRVLLRCFTLSSFRAVGSASPRQARRVASIASIEGALGSIANAPYLILSLDTYLHQLSDMELEVAATFRHHSFHSALEIEADNNEDIRSKGVGDRSMNIDAG